jgi:hypothetical protein
VRATAPGHTDAVLPVTFVVGAASSRALLVSGSPDRAAPAPLAGATVSGNTFIFVREDAGITRVQFWLDDPTQSGPARKNENNAPWDFAGSVANGAAIAFDAGTLPAGTHVVTARVTSGTTTETIHATFTR